MSHSALRANVARLLEAAAVQHASSAAVSQGDELHWTYGQFAVRVSRFAGALRGLGLEPGDRVALVMANGAGYLTALWAIWHAGLCAVPINAKLHAREIAFILADTDAAACLVSAEFEGPIAAVRAQLPALRHLLDVDVDVDGEGLGGSPVADAMACHDALEDSPAWIFYTSGTTGRPKGAVLTHRNLLAMSMRYYGDIDPIQPSDCAILAAPMSHASGLMCIPHVGRAGHHVMPCSGAFDVEEMFGLIARYREVSFFAAPTMLLRLIRHPSSASVPWSHVKTLLYGGAPMQPGDLEEAIARVGACLVQGYGQGESPITLTVLDKAAHADRQHPEYAQRIASVGTARIGVEIRIVDKRGIELPQGGTGEIVARSDVTMSGYWRDAAATAATLREGWLYTGDLGSLTASGLLTLKGRCKDVIISGGSNIYPTEIEQVLLTHPDLLECAVVGQPDAKWGETVVAFLVLRRPCAAVERELNELCLSNIARFKRPKVYRQLPTLPKNSFGKVLRSDLRALASSTE